MAESIAQPIPSIAEEHSSSLEIIVNVNQTGIKEDARGGDVGAGVAEARCESGTASSSTSKYGDVMTEIRKGGANANAMTEYGNESGSHTKYGNVDGNFPSFHVRQREERLFELRQLQHGARTVTREDGPRDRIASFFTRVHDSQHDGQDEEEHRPESVLFEVRQLATVRPVSSLLQTQAFRRQLENAVRGGISRLMPNISITRSNPQSSQNNSQRPQPTRRRSPPSQINIQTSQSIPPPPPPPHQPEVNRDGVVSAEEEEEEEERLPPPPATPWLLQRSSNRQASQVATFPAATAASAATSTSSINDEGTSSTAVLSSASPRNDNETNDTFTGEERAEERRRRRRLAEHMEDNRRDDIVYDISSLVHRGLVSETLQSGFRSTLERQMASRISQVGRETGRRVARFITRLPPPSTGVSRNDFSSLGIANRREVDEVMEDLDSIMEGSSSYIHIQHNNGAVMRELATLKQQMASLQQMMRLQMEMQADMQRAIRQEVSAAIHSSPSASSPSAPSSVARGAEGRASAVVAGLAAGNPSSPGEGACVVCLACDADAVLLNCGHLSCCMGCSQRLRETNGKCPICRAPIRDVIKVYKATAANT